MKQLTVQQVIDTLSKMPKDVAVLVSDSEGSLFVPLNRATLMGATDTAGTIVTEFVALFPEPASL
jgi:hypothetical protein